MKIVCFGDSLTRGVSLVKGRARILKENYPALLEKFFSKNVSDDIVVLNKGVFNDNSDLLVKRVEKDVISEEPNYVLINIGGNDCNFKWAEVAADPENFHSPIVPMNNYIENIKSIITKVREKNITPILLTLPPLDPVKYYSFIASKYGTTISHWISCCGGIEHWHSLYNKQLKKLIDQMNVKSIDVREAINNADNVCNYISDDGIHLNSEGYKEMGSIVFKELLKITGTNQAQLN